MPSCARDRFPRSSSARYQRSCRSLRRELEQGDRSPRKPWRVTSGTSLPSWGHHRTLLLVGLATPIAAALMVADELLLAPLQPADAWAHVLLIALGLALALLGPRCMVR
jgi:hypothetical protein